MFASPFVLFPYYTTFFVVYGQFFNAPVISRQEPDSDGAIEALIKIGVFERIEPNVMNDFHFYNDNIKLQLSKKNYIKLAAEKAETGKNVNIAKLWLVTMKTLFKLTKNIENPQKQNFSSGKW